MVWTITVEADKTCFASCAETGELIEVKRETIESALRTLGRILDRYRREEEEKLA